MHTLFKLDELESKFIMLIFNIDMVELRDGLWMFQSSSSFWAVPWRDFNYAYTSSFHFMNTMQSQFISGLIEHFQRLALSFLGGRVLSNSPRPLVK